jgi:hypothetical protein
MEFVQPIRDKKKIEAMKRIQSTSNNGKRDALMFTMGINSALRISDILLLKISGVLNNKGKPKSFIELREGKTEKSKRFPIALNVQKAIVNIFRGIMKIMRDRCLQVEKRMLKVITMPYQDNKLMRS